MNKIAVLLTCHNRKEKTIACLSSLSDTCKKTNVPIELDIFLTDDGSTDGTSQAISNLFPYVKILKGNGQLYWAGGMINSWKEALKFQYDGFLLLNDDTTILENLFDDLILTDNYSISIYNKKGIYIGSTLEPNSKKISYGGSILLNKFLLKFKKIEPCGTPQGCDLGNANIMYIPKEVVDQIGILKEGYEHGVADYDYTLTGRKNKIPVLVMPNYCGLCLNNPPVKYLKFKSYSIKERKSFLYAPTGLALKDNLLLMKRHFPYRLPFVLLAAYSKLLFPNLYLKLKKL